MNEASLVRGGAASLGTLAEAALGERPGEALDSPVTIAAIRRGLPVGEFEELREMLGLTSEAMATKIGISPATLARRRQAREPLDPAHSDRVVRFARLYWQAAAFFDFNEAAAREWLKRPQRAFDGETPLDYAETEAGAREVEHVLGRLEQGVYL